MDIRETTALELREGDFLVDLDNGYVFDNESARDEVCWQGYAGALDASLRLISFHDAEGNENYLILMDDHPIRAGRL